MWKYNLIPAANFELEVMNFAGHFLGASQREGFRFGECLIELFGIALIAFEFIVVA